MRDGRRFCALTYLGLIVESMVTRSKYLFYTSVHPKRMGTCGRRRIKRDHLCLYAENFVGTVRYPRDFVGTVRYPRVSDSSWEPCVVREERQPLSPATVAYESWEISSASFHPSTLVTLNARSIYGLCSSDTVVILLDVEEAVVFHMGRDGKCTTLCVLRAFHSKRQVVTSALSPVKIRRRESLE